MKNLIYIIALTYLSVTANAQSFLECSFYDEVSGEQIMGGSISIFNKATIYENEIFPDSLGFFKVSLYSGVYDLDFNIRPDEYQYSSLRLHVQDNQDTIIRKKILLKKREPLNCDWVQSEENYDILANTNSTFTQELKLHRMYGMLDKMPGAGCPSLYIEFENNIKEDYRIYGLLAKCDSSIVKLGTVESLLIDDYLSESGDLSIITRIAFKGLPPEGNNDLLLIMEHIESGELVVVRLNRQMKISYAE